MLTERASGEVETVVLLVFLLIKRGRGKGCLVNLAIVDMCVHGECLPRKDRPCFCLPGEPSKYTRDVTWRVGWTTVPDEQ